MKYIFTALFTAIFVTVIWMGLVDPFLPEQLQLDAVLVFLFSLLGSGVSSIKKYYADKGEEE